MKSGKQRKIELKMQKQVQKAKLAKQKLAEKEAKTLAESELAVSFGRVTVDRNALLPNNSYDEPDFFKRGYYLDQPFTCAACNSQEVWTAVQQKWWYEIAKGSLFTIAKFCRTCRHQEQARRAEARRVHSEGIAKKER